MGIVQSLFGGAKLPLRPNGPAPFTQPDETDRQALFWWLKRNTSFTAIDHNAALWRAFAAAWESWMRGMDQPSEHLVSTFKVILDTQVAYERGLKRLHLGDRGVFDVQSAEGWLAKLNTGLVDRRMEWVGDPASISARDGVPLAVVLGYYRAHDAAVAIASHGPGGYTGSRFWQIQAFLRSMPGTHELPVPRWDVNFDPGKAAPKDGIYEQVDDRGHLVSGMAYFVKGRQSAPTEWLEFGPHAGGDKSAAFTWRLLWEDTRYRDGQIPEEEARYPTPTQSVEMAEAPEPPLNLRCEAGQPCPRTGYWVTPAHAEGRHRFEHGQTMPAVGGDYGTTIWQWELDQAP
jgi:hypothetical protein